MVVARLTIPDAAAGQQSVTLHLRDFGGAGDHAFLLLPGSQGYRVDLANDTDPLDPDDPCDDGVARHFAHYQDLAENPPLWTNRLLPHVKFTVWKPRGSVTPQDPSQDPCSLPSFHLNDRPACPLASFDAVTTP
jgi:hypothetical protein